MLVYERTNGQSQLVRMQHVREKVTALHTLCLDKKFTIFIFAITFPAVNQFK